VSRDLKFVPAERILQYEGDFPKIVEFLKKRDWSAADWDQLAVHALFDKGWYLLERRRFAWCVQEFLKLPKRKQTVRNFKDIFGLQGYRRFPVISPLKKGIEPAIVLSSDDILEGAWVRRPRRSRAKPPLRDKMHGFGPNTTVPRDTGESFPSDTRDSFEPALATGRGSPPVDDALRRTPHIGLHPEPPIAAGSEFDVEVFADDASPTEGEDSEPIELSGPAEQFELSVWLAGSAELEVLGVREQLLRISRREARSSSARFRVKVRVDAAVGALGALTASFSYNGRPCGRVTRTLLIGGPNTPKPSDEKATGRDFSGVVRVESEAPPPADLRVLVTCPDGKADLYQVKVTTALLETYKDGVTRPWTLKSAADVLVRAMLAKFTKGGISKEQRLDNLVGAGRDLFEASPAHFRDAFWELVRRKAPLKTISVVSEEPHIPWELMVPVPAPSDDDGRKWKPLGVEFAMGRWIHNGHLSPPGAVELTSACILAPDYTGSKQAVLQNSKPESDYISQHFHGVVFKPARYLDIRKRVKGEMAPLFHFVGHGKITDDFTDEQFALEEEETLSATETRGMDGFRDGLRKERPLVFLNACEVGRPIPSLIGAGGFPQTFAQLGASAVIAPLWSVRDSCAHEVAVALYDAVREGAQSGLPLPVAEILQKIRDRAYAGTEVGEDSYAAYCFYGDPSFVVRVPDVGGN
jgi:CHAT domain-containing protein